MIRNPEFRYWNFRDSVILKISVLKFSVFGNIENFNIEIFGISGSRTSVFPGTFSISGSRSPPYYLLHTLEIEAKFKSVRKKDFYKTPTKKFSFWKWNSVLMSFLFCLYSTTDLWRENRVPIDIWQKLFAQRGCGSLAGIPNFRPKTMIQNHWKSF